MATRKRRSTKRRRVTRARAHNPVNPTRRRRRSTRRRTTVHARRRHSNPINPTHRRRRRIGRRRHHRNPLHGAGSEILNFTVAGLAQGIAAPIVGGFAARLLPFGQYNAPIITAGTGWLLSKAFGMFGFTKRFSHPALVFGFAAAAMQVLQPIVARTLAGSGMSGVRSGYGPQGMAGIGMVTGIPPLITAPPVPPQNDQRGMNGMSVRPGVYAR